MHGPMPGQWGWGRGNTELEMTFGVENVAGFEIGKIMSENSLVFSSLEFLFRFLPVFLVIFYLTPVKYRKIVLFIGSILMYACGEPQFVLLLLACTALNFLIGRNMRTDTESPGGIRSSGNGFCWRWQRMWECLLFSKLEMLRTAISSFPWESVFIPLK